MFMFVFMFIPARMVSIIICFFKTNNTFMIYFMIKTI